MCLCGTLRWSGGGGVVDGLLPNLEVPHLEVLCELIF